MLNLNRTEVNETVQHKIVTQYIRDSDLKEPMRAIFSTYAYVMVLVEGEEGDGYSGFRTRTTRRTVLPARSVRERNPAVPWTTAMATASSRDTGS